MLFGAGLRTSRRRRLLGVLVVGALLLVGVTGGAGTGRSGPDALRVVRTAVSLPAAVPAAPNQARDRSGGTDRVAAVPASVRVDHQSPGSASAVRTAQPTPVPGSASPGLLPERRGPPVASFVVVLPDRGPHAASALRFSPGAARAPPLSA